MPAVEHSLVTEKAAPACRDAQTGPARAEAIGPTVVCRNDYNSPQDACRRDVFRGIGTAELCRFTRHLATLLRAGMPLVPALSALSQQLQDTGTVKRWFVASQSDRLAQIVREVSNGVSAGSCLATALAQHPHVFSNLFVNMVAAGETGGSLEQVLFRLAEMLQKRAALTAKVKAALAYPTMMVVVATAVVVFLLSFVVPSITQIFLEMNRSLPAPTRLLIAVSDFLKHYIVMIVVLGAGAACGAAAWLRTKDGRLFADRYKLKLPLVGKLLVKAEIARLSRTLGTLLASGVTILEALRIAKGVVRNSFIAGHLDSVADSVSKGESIADAMKRTGMFGPLMHHVLATGQISGDIEAGLLDLAQIYDDEVELTTKSLTSLLEPAILLAMGVVVGFIVMAILLPIFEINQNF